MISIGWGISRRQTYVRLERVDVERDVLPDAHGFFIGVLTERAGDLCDDARCKTPHLRLVQGSTRHAFERWRRDALHHERVLGAHTQFVQGTRQGKNRRRVRYLSVKGVRIDRTTGVFYGPPEPNAVRDENERTT